MCLNPLEISYSHIVEITLQDTPNVISRGFSTSICCQGKTRTSNIMDFSLHLPYVRSSQRFCSVRQLNSYSHLSLWWIRALFQLCVMTLTNELYLKKKKKDLHRERKACGENPRCLLGPGGKLGFFTFVALTLTSNCSFFPPLSRLRFTRSTPQKNK